MKQIFTFILIAMFSKSFCQNNEVSGQITLTNTDIEYKNLTVLLINKDSIITGAIPNESGYFKLVKKVSNGNYIIKITQLGTRDFLIDSIIVDNKNNINLNIVYPGKCKYTKSKKPKCVENHFDNIIPIVYGLPSKKMMLKAKKELIHLGGCVTYGCDPNYYCKIHKIEF